MGYNHNKGRIKNMQGVGTYAGKHLFSRGNRTIASKGNVFKVALLIMLFL